MNLLLLCGLDGTGILFKPFLDAMPADIRAKTQLLIHQLNETENQSLSHQASLIESQLKKRFNNKPVIIVAESYSGLLAYQLLLRQKVDIEKVFFIACFLQRPSQCAHLAKYAYFIKPKWIKYAGDRVLKYVVFNRFATDELLALFQQAMTELENPKKRAMFVQRCDNIANLPSHFTAKEKMKTPCVYFQAQQDNLVSYDNMLVFTRVFTDCSVISLNGSHFLLQTNPLSVWQNITNHL